MIYYRYETSEKCAVHKSRPAKWMRTGRSGEYSFVCDACHDRHVRNRESRRGVGDKQISL